MVFGRGCRSVPAAYKRAAWSVYNSDTDARLVVLRLTGMDSPKPYLQLTCHNKWHKSPQ